MLKVGLMRRKAVGGVDVRTGDDDLMTDRGGGLCFPGDGGGAAY